VAQLRPEPGRPDDRVGVLEATVRPADAIPLDRAEHRQRAQQAAVDGGLDPAGAGHPGRRDDAGQRAARARRRILKRYRVDARLDVELLILEELDRPSRHPGERLGDVLQLHQEADRTGATADDHHVLVGELGRVAVVHGMQVAPAEIVHARIPRDERRPPGPGRVHQHPGRDLAGAVLAFEVHQESVGGRVHPCHVRRSHHLQLVVLLVAAVEVRHHVLGRRLPVRRVEADAELLHAGQIIDPVRIAEPQGLPAELPGAARARTAIEQHELIARIQSQATQVVRDRQPRLSCADHDHGRVGGALGHPITLPAGSAAGCGRTGCREGAA